MIVFFVLCACNSKPAVPDGILSEETMQSVLMEVHLAEAIVTADFQKGIDAKLRQQNLIDSLLLDKQIDHQTFLASYEYYLAHPERMDSIYTHMIDSLNHALTRARAIESEKK